MLTPLYRRDHIQEMQNYTQFCVNGQKNSPFVNSVAMYKHSSHSSHFQQSSYLLVSMANSRDQLEHEQNLLGELFRTCVKTLDRTDSYKKNHEFASEILQRNNKCGPSLIVRKFK